MNNKLLLICLLLLLIFTLEWLYLVQAQKQLLSAAGTKANPSTNTLMPSFSLNQLPETSYSDLVDRPLFIRGRRPVADTNSPHMAGQANDVNWQLSGVYTTRKGLMALLTRIAENTVESKPYRKVIIGNELDGWTVTGIYSDRIKLTSNSINKDLLLRKPRAKTSDVPVPVKNAPQTFDSGRAARMRPIPPPNESQPEQPTDTVTHDNNAKNP